MRGARRSRPSGPRARLGRDPTSGPGLAAPSRRPAGSLRARAHRVIFESDTSLGKAFDVVLIGAILASVVVVMLDTVETFRELHGDSFRRVEWGFTLLFTVEYAVRLWAAKRPSRYALSFYGVVDLLSVLPTYLSILLPGGSTSSSSGSSGCYGSSGS